MATTRVELTEDYQEICTGASVVLVQATNYATVVFAEALPAASVAGLTFCNDDDQPQQYTITSYGGKVYARGVGYITVLY